MSKWGDDMRARIDRIGGDRIILEATTGTMLEVGERVWTRGLLTNGSPLTYAENYEVYISKPPFPRVGSQKGKPFNLWAKPPVNLKGNARAVKGGWAPTYLAAKAQVGRGDFPFELTGDMRKDWFGGVTPQPTEVDELTVVIDMDGKNAAKANGLAASKGEFLILNDEEITSHTLRVADLWRTALS